MWFILLMKMLAHLSCILRSIFYFTPPLKDSDLYLKSTLEQFFVVRRYVESELDKLKNQEELKYNGR